MPFMLIHANNVSCLYTFGMYTWYTLCEMLHCAIVVHRFEGGVMQRKTMWCIVGKISHTRTLCNDEQYIRWHCKHLYLQRIMDSIVCIFDTCFGRQLRHTNNGDSWVVRTTCRDAIAVATLSRVSWPQPRPHLFQSAGALWFQARECHGSVLHAVWLMQSKPTLCLLVRIAYEAWFV